ncbi:hypothetical protein EST38_g8807 [Candolleomyces aberdarensis]|uniref:Uncharacterized protein n=1 Tax=Candolleomyces aberdarensis TaxID=2316362 RepID=A0A4Q2DEG8_9AGAR|nr:hypothetical protein EST38_g8807 [Candolleomyces aberdarensis]
MSRTLEGMLQKLRINARHEEVPDDMAPGAHAASSSRDAQITWPILETICIDSMLAADLADVCLYISSNSNIKTVCLSGPARRHLFDSVKRRLSTNTFFHTNFYTRRNDWDALKAKDGGTDTSNTESASEWLKRRVQIIRFEEFDIRAPDLGLYVPS